MKSDGSIIIDTKIVDGGMEKGFDIIRNEMQSVGITAKQVGNQIALSFSNFDVSKPIANAAARVRTLEQQLAATTTEFNLAVADDDDTVAERLGNKRIALYDRLAAARQKLAIEISAAANRQAAAESAAAAKAAASEQAAASKKVSAARTMFASVTKAGKKFATRLSGILSSALVFSALYAGLRKVTEYFGKALKSNAQFTQSFSKLKASLLTAFQPIYEFVLPAIISLMNILSKFVQVIGHIFAMLGRKSDQQISKNAKALYKQANATEAVGKASRKAKKDIARFDQINKLSGDDSQASASAETSTPDFSEFDTESYKSKIDELTTYVSLATLVLGAILAFSGVNIPLGISLLALGAVGLGTEIATNWSAVKDALQGSAGMIISLLSGAFLVLGAILAFSGANIPLGIGLMAVGAVGLATAIAANWETIKNKLKGPIGGIVALISGATLALGAVLAFSGANIPLGIALMAVGAAGLVTTVAVNWETIKENLRGPVGGVVAIVSGALLALGAILAFTGVALPLGIGLMAAGTIGLAATASLNWDTIKEKLRGPVGGVVAIVSTALLALGAVLAFTGVGLPLGIALMAIGAAGLATTASLNWDIVKSKIKTVLASILSILSGAAIVLGVLMCLSGAGLGIGLALIFAGVAGSIAAWKLDDNPITRFVKNIANSIISLVNMVIDAVNGLFHIRFNGLKIGDAQIIPKINTRLLNIPKIPLLAEGAVIPPNREFMAVLGDQRHGTNIEAPLSTIQEAVANVMNENISAMMAGFEALLEENRQLRQVVEGIEVGDATIGEAVNRYNRKMAVVRGG